jgi:hypothetical protein
VVIRERGNLSQDFLRYAADLKLEEGTTLFLCLFTNIVYIVLSLLAQEVFFQLTRVAQGAT